MNKILLALGLSVLSTGAAQAGTVSTNSLNFDFNAIIGGTAVQPGQPLATSTVMILGKESGGDGGTFICSGTVIDKDLVLTAAHCLGQNGRAQVAVMFSNAISKTAAFGQVVAAVRDADYMKGVTNQNDNNWNDLAMLRLAQPAPAGYVPAKLNTAADLVTDGEAVTLAGYGITMPVASNDPKVDDGAGTLRSVGQTVKNSQYSDTEFTVNLTGGKGACHGDSGGPVYVQKNGQLIQVGVASRMTDADRVANNGDVSDFACSVEMVYTSVSAQQAWIQKASARLHNLDLNGGDDSNF